MNPAISIIVPVYNVEPYLRRCLDSILAQTFTDIEVIVVNDGSTDRSGEICDEFAEKDKRIRVIHKKNGGLSSARNAGLDIVKGEYIGFVDSDDYIDINMYKKLYELCIYTRSDISICTFGEVNEKNVSVPKKEKDLILEMDNNEGLRQLFKGEIYRFSVCNKLFNRKCISNIKFPVGFLHEDLATSYQMFAKANKVVFTNFTGYMYFKRENSILTTNYKADRLISFSIWDKIISFMRKEYPELSKEYFSSFVFWSIDNSYYIVSQIRSEEEKMKFLKIIQSHIKNHYKQVMKNDLLSIKYKFLITLINYNPRLFYFQHRINTLLRTKY
ncbi:glycosyltransferase [Halobacillus sp. A5]|uniref:glycosyltransferase family 2 protein n=1 Tax=Halobacillus sp. A5 TaxID=2880263 RepID=UPI0020A67E5C|nr:glycosyltransferase [Halobacillus sp. A5]MCP3029190.1 glycosyltransferase [Halobacillus sp. A5]